MIYKVLITPVEPSINDGPNFSGILAAYNIEASSESVAGDLAGVYSVLRGDAISLTQTG